jgi:hypothetical protein
MMDECLKNLCQYKVLDEIDTQKEFDLFEESIPITWWARVDWDNIENKVNIFDLTELKQELIKRGVYPKEKIVILWDEASLPAIETNLNHLFNAIEYVLNFSFDTWIFCYDKGFII